MLRSVLACAAFLVAVSATGQFDEIVAAVNSNPNSTWVAQAPDRFGNFADVRMVCGTWLKGNPNHTILNLPKLEDSQGFQARRELDDGFDVRTAFPNCTVLAKVRDQSACGSCWAFGSTETFEGRKCIAQGQDIEYSADDTAGCATSAGMGCDGGQPDSALEWISSTGVVTGGDYADVGTGTSCKPYEFKACAHHVPASAKYPACPSAEYSIRCHKSCDTKYNKTYAADKVKGGKVHSISSVAGIVTALAKGPVSVAFTVYADFPTYKSGVYKHTSGSELGGHAVAIIGYGTENGQAYWLVKNSWNEQWGDGGTFKIAKGHNECGIEEDASVIDF